MDEMARSPGKKRAQQAAGQSGSATGVRPARTTRLPAAERRAQIIAKAGEYFAENGLTAQTRGLAEACGVSQRLLYRLFPSKAALLQAVYDNEILGPFKAVWLLRLKDRRRSVEARLVEFYEDYFDTILTGKWLRLFLSSSLAEGTMAPEYISAIVMELTETIAEEVAAARGIDLPEDRDLVHEIGWALHGNVSHLAIRRHLYHTSDRPPIDRIIRLHIDVYLGGFAAMLANLAPDAARIDAA